MRLMLLLTTLSLFTLNAYAENSILGKWKDKSDPSAHKYEFKEGHNFIYIQKWNYQGKSKSSTSKGVWEIGEWTITSFIGGESSCNLMIYADSKQCCFNFKFIANYLILTIKHKSEGNGAICKNRVLIKDK